MTVINPYLTFDGNCEEAFDYYRKIFGGEFSSFARFSEMPHNDEYQLTEEKKNQILHVSLPISKETVLMGSDTMPGYEHKIVPCISMSLSVTVSSNKRADHIYNMLARNGKNVIPLGKSFWGAYFGIVVDQFGFSWMISCFKNK